MSINKTVSEIVLRYLKRGGSGGLVSEGNDCGCRIGDLYPCSKMVESCSSSYVHFLGDAEAVEDVVQNLEDAARPTGGK